MTRSIGAASVLLAGLSASAYSQTASLTVSNVGPAGDLGDPNNSVASGSFTETFVAQSLTWSGTLASSPNFFFFEEDVFASIKGPNGLVYSGPVAGEQGIVLGQTTFSGWTSGFTPASVNGSWAFEAYTPNTFPDATNWSIANAEFAFSASLFPEATTVTTGQSLTASLNEGEILWYSIDHQGGGLDISTAGSSILELDGAIQTDDTLIALFDGTGSLVEFNDDSGSDFTSRLTFESLAAGEYRLAVTGSTLGTRVGESFISTSHDGEGTILLSVAIPAPATFVPLGVAFASIRRRRVNQ